MPRRKIKFDPTKNRKLDEFLTQLHIKDEKKDKIMEFVENLTFEKVKEASSEGRYSCKDGYWR